MTGDLSQAVDRFGPRTGAPSDDDAGARGVAPLDLCRITVLARAVQVDLALPTDVPIALLVPGIVELLDRRTSRSQPADPHHGPQPWVLSKVGLPPFTGTLTLTEAGVRDGDLLVLGTAETPAPPPLFDDLMHAVATAGEPRNRLWTSRTAQGIGFGIGAVAILLACLALVRAPFDAGPDHAAAIDIGIAAALTAILFTVAGTIVGRVYDDDRTGTFLSGCALPLIFTSGVMFVPGQLGGAHLLLGASMTVALAVLALRLGGHGTALFTGTATASVIAAGAAILFLFTELSAGTVGAGVAVISLFGLAFAPRVSMMQAKLPLPPVPTAGAPLDDTNDDDGHSVEELAELSSRARSYLTGLVYAACVTTTTGALVAALPSTSAGIYWPGVTLALLIALVLILRGRTFAENQHAIPLVAGGSTIVLALLSVVIFAFPQEPLSTFAAAVGIAVVALLFGSVIPTRTYSPVLRRAAELIEYATIATVIPVACWVSGLYTAMRGL